MCTRSVQSLILLLPLLLLSAIACSKQQNISIYLLLQIVKPHTFRVVGIYQIVKFTAKFLIISAQIVLMDQLDPSNVPDAPNFSIRIFYRVPTTCLAHANHTPSPSFKLKPKYLKVQLVDSFWVIVVLDPFLPLGHYIWLLSFSESKVGSPSRSSISLDASSSSMLSVSSLRWSSSCSPSIKKVGRSSSIRLLLEEDSSSESSLIIQRLLIPLVLFYSLWYAFIEFSRLSSLSVPSSWAAIPISFRRTDSLIQGGGQCNSSPERHK